MKAIFNKKINYIVRSMLKTLMAMVILLALTPVIANAQITYPEDATVTAGDNVTFTFPETSATNFQWQVSTNGGTSWSNLTDNLYYYGVTSAELYIYYVPTNFNGNKYRVLYTISTSDYVSNSATLKVNSREPDIKSQPFDQFTTEGTGTFFEIVISNADGSKAYQWQYFIPGIEQWFNVSNTGIYSGATTSVLTLSNGVTTDYNGYRYRCIVTHTDGSANPVNITSNIVTLYVYAYYGPMIILHPTDKYIIEGSNTSFSITMRENSPDGYPFNYTYQWLYSPYADSDFSNVPNSGIFSGATTATLSLTNVPIDYSGYQFRCEAIATGWDYVKLYSEVAILTVTADNYPPYITTTFLPDGTQGISYNATLMAIGTSPITWSVVEGALPDGLSLNPNTGLISGTPTKAGTFIFDVRAENPFGSYGRLFTITIDGIPPIITTTSLPDGLLGISYSTTLTATGTPPITWSLVESALPDDLSLNPNTGLISGTPTKTGTFSFDVRAENMFGTDERNFTIKIDGIPPIITTTSLPNGFLGISYSATLTATGTPPITWSMVESKLPDGLSLNVNTGLISGTPTVTGTFSFSVRAENLFGSDMRNFTIKIDGFPPVITTISLPDGTQGISYNATLTATGTPPITWSMVESKLPDGLSLNTNTGLISGTPAATGTFSFNIRAENLYGSDMRNFTIVINIPPPEIVIEITSPTESFCTVDDYLSIPFSKIDNEHPMKYSIIFSDDAKAAGFSDKTSFENLPAEQFFKITIPKGAPTKLYSGNVMIECEGINNYTDKYPFTFSVINNGVAIINQPPPSQSLCGGATIALLVDITGNASSYQWYKNGQAISGAQNMEYETNTEGIYYVEIMGECGIIRSEVAVVTSPSSSPTSIGIRVKWGNVLYVENASGKYQRYQWYHNGIAINGATFVYLSEEGGFLGEYIVRCYKSDGSFDESCPVVFGIRTKSSSASIYPTVLKTNDLLNINIIKDNFNTEAIVEIYSALGIQVYSTKITTPFATIKPNIQHKGSYFVKIRLSSGEIFNDKIIIQ